MAEALSMEQEFQRQLAALQSRRYSGLEPRSIAWLALPPGWTLGLAQACGFPTGRGVQLVDYLKQLQAAGLVQLQESAGRTDFWVTYNELPGLTAWLKQRLDLAELFKIVAEIGRSLLPYLPADENAEPPTAQFKNVLKSALSRPQEAPDVPDSMLLWGRLANLMDNPAQAADWLDDKVIALLDARRESEAIAWLEAARPLANLLGGQLESVVRLGSRRLELVYRRIQDERYLVEYQERPEQLEPFYHLLDNADGVWALHYLGMGGVGKTMLLRYISANCPGANKAPPKGYVACRVDFDYISPDFPYKKPGQLLLELAAELRLHGVTTTALDRFKGAASLLHQLLLRKQGVYDLAAFLKDDPEIGESFDRVLEAFYALLREASGPQGNQLALLVMDTCEELAKVPSADGRLVAVEATFYMLERLRGLHDVLHPGEPLPFRVIFSGRRLLAQSGWEWYLPSDQAGGKRALLPGKKDYLDLHELRGFNLDDLKQYYSQKKKLPTQSPAVCKAILRSSIEPGRTAQVVSTRANYSPRLYRYNPFDLSLFGDWILSDPELSAAQIASGVQDPYVEFRLLGRLRSDNPLSAVVKALLPHLVLLKRIDETLLRSLCTALSDQKYEDIYRELGDQEWVDYRVVNELQTTFLEVDTNMLPRLQRYYGLESRPCAPPLPQERCDQVNSARSRLGALLSSLILGQDGQAGVPLSSLHPGYVDTALRLLPPEDAAALWATVEGRIAAQLGWGSADRFMELILPEEAEKERSEHPIWPAVLATQAAVLLHTRPEVNRRGTWQDVFQLVGNYPSGAGRERLALRAKMGIFASSPLQIPGSPAPWDDPAFFTTLLEPLEQLAPLPPASENQPPEVSTQPDAELAAAACAALSTVLDSLEASTSRAWPGQAIEYSKLRDLAGRLKDLPVRRDLIAFASCLLGRLAALVEGQEAGWIMLRNAAWQTPLAGESLDRNSWLDWLPPVDLLSRLRLEALRRLPVRLSPADWDDLLTWRMAAVADRGPGNADREALISSALQAELARRPVALKTLDEISQGFEIQPHLPECLAHQLTPPLLLALCRAYLALGDGQQAMNLVMDYSVKGQDTRLLQASRQGMLECLRRLRLYSEALWIKEWAESGKLEQASLAWPAVYLSGQYGLDELKMPSAPSAEWLHLWSSILPSSAVIFRSERPQAWDNQASSAVNGLVLDGLEKTATARGEPAYDVPGWLARHPGQEEDALRLALHAAASGKDVGARRYLQDDLFQRLPTRLCAQIALEEGELLALRQPESGAWMLSLAASTFTGAGDTFGALQATTCQALSEARGNMDLAARTQTLEKTLQPLYEANRITHPNLPEWQPLLEASQKGPQGFAQVTAGVPSWRGWLTNILAARLAALPNQQETIRRLLDPNLKRQPPELDWLLAYARFADLLQNQTQMAQGRVQQEQVQARMQEGQAQSVKVGKRQTTISPISGGSLIRILGYIVLTVIILAVLGLAGAGIYKIFQVYRTVVYALGAPATLPGWSITISLPALLVLLAALVIFIRMQVTSLGRLDLDISSSAGNLVYTLTRHRPGLGLRWPPLFMKTISWNWQGNPPAAGEVKSLTSRKKDFTEAIKHLRSLVAARALRSTPWAISLEKATQLFSRPWEQILATTIKKDDPLRVLNRLGLYRRISGAEEKGPWLQVGWDFGLVRIVCSSSAAIAVVNGWKGRAPILAQNSVTPSQPMSLDPPPDPNKPAGEVETDLVEKILLAVDPDYIASPFRTPLPQPEKDWVKLFFTSHPTDKGGELVWLPAWQRAFNRAFRRSRQTALFQLSTLHPEMQLPFRVLHLVGTPTRTPSGLVWQVVSAQTVEASYQTKTYEYSQGGSLIIPEQLPVRQTPLVILQVEPSLASSTDLGDEGMAGDLRTYAANLIQLGARAVLALPSLPYEWAPPVLQAATRDLRGGHPPELAALLRSAAAVRRTIVKQPLAKLSMSRSATDREKIATRLRLATQVCLLIRARPGEVP